jgi:hypothetical protein
MHRRLNATDFQVVGHASATSEHDLKMLSSSVGDESIVNSSRAAVASFLQSAIYSTPPVADSTQLNSTRQSS